MNLVDSCGWLEYFAGTKHAKNYAEAIEDPENLIVPTICLHEVFRVVYRQRTEDESLQAIALMRQGQVVDLSEIIALRAAKIGVERKIPLADSVILATAREFDAEVWTQDGDFEGLPRVNYFSK